MNITKDAISLLSNVVFSCDPIGKQKDVKNEKFIAECAKRNTDMNFEDFCSGLLDGYEREMKIRELALGLGKVDIDYETICIYFGGGTHTAKTLSDLKAEGMVENSVFSLYMVFMHLITPVVIRSIDTEKKTISATYENDGILVKLNGLLYRPEDEKFLSIGNICLAHYPFVADVYPNGMIVQKLKRLQLQDEKFLLACKCFEKTGLDHSKYIYYGTLRRRIYAQE